MRVLVTGVRGFIGQSLAPALVAQGHEVRSGIDGCDAVVHLANIAHTAAHPEDLQRVNVDGTRRQAERAVAAGVRRFVYLSSVKAASCDDAYGRTKLAAEHALACVRGLERVVLRPPLVYGPGVKANFLALMKLIKSGWPLPLASIENRRSLLYVGNLCDAIVLCLQAPLAAGGTYGVSDGEPVSTPRLCRALANALGQPSRLFSCPPGLLDLLGGERARRLTGSLVIDDHLIREQLGWRPRYSLAEGLRVTADWYRAQAS